MTGFALLTALLAFVGTVQCAGPNVLSQIFADLKLGYSSQLSDLQADFVRRQTENDKRYAELEKKYDSLLDILNDNPQNRVARVIPMTTASPRPKVSFYVQLSKNVQNIGNFQSIVFDMVTTNNGNGYNKADGVFTAPTPGTYVFSWTAANEVHTHMQTELVVNAKVFGRTWSDAYDHNDVAIGSNTVVANLKEGDTVWIRSTSLHSGFIMGSQLSTFSGWLLR